MKNVFFFLIAFIFSLDGYPGYSADQDTINQLSKISGLPSNRVAKMAQLREVVSLAARYSIKGKYREAIAEMKKITAEAGFESKDVKEARVTLYQIYKRAGHYQEAMKVAESLIPVHWVYEDHYDEVKAIVEFQKTNDKKYIDEYLSEYYRKNKKLLPPKSYDLSMLAILIRLHETAGEIDQALELAEKYFSKKSLEFHQMQKSRDGLKLLQAALLRDQKEGKNIYAQELINTTDYFGFV